MKWERVTGRVSAELSFLSGLVLEVKTNGEVESGEGCRAGCSQPRLRGSVDRGGVEESENLEWLILGDWIPEKRRRCPLR